MTKGSRFAVALILFWLAFTCLYVAFHPGGIQLPGPDPDTGKGSTHPARNPSDVAAHLISQMATPQSAGTTQGA